MLVLLAVTLAGSIIIAALLSYLCRWCAMSATLKKSFGKPVPIHPILNVCELERGAPYSA